MNAVGKDTLDILIAIGACHQRLTQHAITLREFPSVRSVSHVVDLPRLETAFRYVEYIDAELTSGEAISWCLELTVSRDEISIDADVRRIHRDGQDVLSTVKTRDYDAIGECVFELSGVAERLCTANPLH
jgi:hypothetical protein